MDLHISSEQVYRDYKNKVFGYIFNRIHNHALAEELTSDVFVKIVANIDRFDMGFRYHKKHAYRAFQEAPGHRGH